MHVRPGDEDGEYREGGGDGVELEPLVHRLLPHQRAGGEVRHHVNLDAGPSPKIRISEEFFVGIFLHTLF
jgi:hypothetical protein